MSKTKEYICKVCDQKCRAIVPAEAPIPTNCYYWMGIAIWKFLKEGKDDE